MIPRLMKSVIGGITWMKLKTPGPMRMPARIDPTNGIKPIFRNASYPSFANITRMPRYKSERSDSLITGMRDMLGESP
ncbi:MAG TPA: hypothetical protein VN739_04335 [Nitrososphaerales archaeon]|nr:hypothetical protein [Nitrososphaerales archaeon]